MEDFELKVSNTPGAISINFEEIEANLKNVLADYKGIVVTEDTIKNAKKDIAELRKKRTEIDNARKEVKKAWNEPYLEFEKKCKDLLSLVDEPILALTAQLDAFETKRIEEKEKHLHVLYEECIGEYGDYLTYKDVYNPKWLNVSTTDKEVRYDVSERVVKVRSDLDVIRSLHSPIEEELLKVYKETKNVLAAVSRNTDYLDAKKLAEEKLAEEQIAKEAVKAAEEVKAEEPKEEIEIKDLPFTEEDDFMNPPVYHFVIEGIENYSKVKEYLDFAEIPYKEV